MYAVPSQPGYSMFEHPCCRICKLQPQVTLGLSAWNVSWLLLGPVVMLLPYCLSCRVFHILELPTGSPAGLPNLVSLNHACRTGCSSLGVSDVEALATAGQQLQELDISLHGHLDDKCMRWLARFQKLRQVSSAEQSSATHASVLLRVLVPAKACM